MAVHFGRPSVCQTVGCCSVDMLEEDKDDPGTYYCYNCWEEREMKNLEAEYNEQLESCEQQQADKIHDEAPAAAQALKDKEWPTLSHSMQLQEEEQELKDARRQLIQNTRKNGRQATSASKSLVTPEPEVSPSS